MPKKQLESDFHKIIENLLEEQDVTAECGVVEQLVNFCHGFITKSFTDAKNLDLGNGEFSPEHIYLAQALTQKNVFLNSDTYDNDIQKLADVVNAQEFPISSETGNRIPKDEECLITPNFQCNVITPYNENKDMILNGISTNNNSSMDISSLENAFENFDDNNEGNSQDKNKNQIIEIDEISIDEELDEDEDSMEKSNLETNKQVNDNMDTDNIRNNIMYSKKD